MMHVQHGEACRWASVRRATGFVGQRLERLLCCAALCCTLLWIRTGRRQIRESQTGVITGVVRGDDIGQLLLREGLLLAGVPLLEFVHHGDDTVETFGHAGPHPVLKEYKRSVSAQTDTNRHRPIGIFHFFTAV